MNYEDELERAQARKSRKRQSRENTAGDYAYDSGEQDRRQRAYENEDGHRSGRISGTGGASRERRRSGEYEHSGDGHSDKSRLGYGTPREGGYSSGSVRQSSGRRSGPEDRWSAKAEPGSRASRSGNAGDGRNNGNRGFRKKNNTKKIAIGVVLGIIAVILAVVIGAYAYIRINLSGMDKNPFDKEEVENTAISLETRQKMEKGFWTIAIFGLDSRDNSTGKGNQSDVIMIANLNRETGEIKLVSVFRDTYMNVTDKNSYNKINAAYANGGPQEAVKALNKNLDLNITSYAAFNWKAVATAINILGGVDVDISKTEFYYINAFITETVKGTGIGSVQLKSAGPNHLDGVQAVAYGRLRLMDTDYARTERQRIIIQKAFEKAKTADLATLNSLVGNMFAMCATNINELDILRMVKDVKKYHLGETMGFPAARGEKKISIGGRKSDCVVPETLASNVRDLHKFLFGTEDYVPTSTVQNISKKISEVSGLSKEGTPIDHVPTNKGYIPKATAAPRKTTEAQREEESDESSEDETLESETLETLPGESSSGMGGNPLPDNQSSIQIYPTSPTGSTYPGDSDPYDPSVSDPYYPVMPTDPSETSRPQSPADMTQATEAPIGPAYQTTEADIPEATTAPISGPASQATQPGVYSAPVGNNTSPSASSSVIISPTEGLSPGSTDGPEEFPGAGA